MVHALQHGASQSFGAVAGARRATKAVDTMLDQLLVWADTLMPLRQP